jgi:hypothetical protein
MTERLIVAMQECSAGNESVGSAWLEARTFDPMTPVYEIIAWGKTCSPYAARGKLIIIEENAK